MTNMKNSFSLVTQIMEVLIVCSHEELCYVNSPIDMNKIITDFAMELLRVKKRFAENGKNYCSSPCNVCGRNSHKLTPLCLLQR